MTKAQKYKTGTKKTNWPESHLRKKERKNEVKEELSKYNIVSKYCKYIPELKRRENWHEAVSRNKEMMLEKYAEFGIDDEINWAYKFVEDKKIVGSMRAMQYGGTPMMKNNARGYNCVGSWCDRLRFFQECMWLLLSGCGTGFSVQKHHVEQLPCFTHKRLYSNDVYDFPVKIYTIPDSIEGWADALGVLLSSYFENPVFPEYYNRTVVFDDSDIRPEGSYLSSGVGKAPGSKPLMKALKEVERLLDRCVEAGQKKLRPIDAYDIVMHSSDCVLSGGVRRSATICLFSYGDEEMMKAKTGNWLNENRQRARSNNSVVLNPSKITLPEFRKLFQEIKEFGEPGFVFGDKDISINPCAEISFYPYDEKTEATGWGFCNLCEINGGTCEDESDFYNRCKAAAIIGTLQAGFTNFPYLTEASKNIAEREALLGVSITGLMDRYSLFSNNHMLSNGAKICLDANAYIAKKIGINPTSRATCNKPSGTTTCVFGCDGSGAHPAHSKRYIRHVQANRSEGPYQYFKQFNAVACEKSVWSANDTDDIIAFCVESQNEDCKTKSEVDAITFLENVIRLQKNWINTGTNPDRLPKQWLSHSVSNTCVVQSHEWDAVADFIFNNRFDLRAVSLIGATGDKDYEQAPFVAVYSAEEIQDIYKITKEDFNILYNVMDTQLKFPNLTDKETEYLVKDVRNLKKFNNILDNYRPVDYNTMIEDGDFVSFKHEAACAGGVCIL